MKPIVVIGKKGCKLSSAVAKAYGLEFIPFELDHFADTETNFTLPNSKQIKGKNIIIVWQFDVPDTSKGININGQVFEFLCLIGSFLFHFEFDFIDVVMPYFPYARQDVQDEDSDNKCMVDVVSMYYNLIGVSQLASCDLHDSELVHFTPFDLCNVSLAKVWSSALRENVLQKDENKNFCIVSPDHGGAKRADDVAKLLGQESAVVIEKKRVGKDKSVALGIEGDVAGKVAIVVDDILDTGHTAVNACNLLLEKGATKVLGCFTHSVMSRETHDRMVESKFSKIYLTDTLLFDESQLDEKFKVFSMHDVLCDFLKRILSYEE